MCQSRAPSSFYRRRAALLQILIDDFLDPAGERMLCVTHKLMLEQ